MSGIPVYGSSGCDPRTLAAVHSWTSRTGAVGTLQGVITDMEDRMSQKHWFGSIFNQADPSEPRNAQLCPGLLTQGFIQLEMAANTLNSINLLKFFPFSSVSGIPHIDCMYKCQVRKVHFRDDLQHTKTKAEAKIILVFFIGSNWKRNKWTNKQSNRRIPTSPYHTQARAGGCFCSF